MHCIIAYTFMNNSEATHKHSNVALPKKAHFFGIKTLQMYC